MIFYASGYSERQFNPDALRQKAKTIAEWLPQIMEATGADAVVVTGKSGMSLAFATMMLLDYSLIVVRKKSESSHGHAIEGDHRKDVKKYIILDDFVCSGKTVTTIINSISENWYNDGYPHEGGCPQCVGIIEYDAGEWNESINKAFHDIKHYTERDGDWEIDPETTVRVPSFILENIAQQERQIPRIVDGRIRRSWED